MPSVERVRFFPSVLLIGFAICVSYWDAAFAQGLGATQTPRSDDVLGCVIKPSEIITIGSSADGIIAEIPVDMGDTVEAGQIVARIGAGVEAAAVEIARAQANDRSAVNAAEVMVALKLDRKERAEKLFQTALESRENFIQLRKEHELAEVELRQARVRLEMARLELKRTEAILALRTITTPMKGLVTERKKSTGEYAEVGDDLLTIAKLDPLHVEAFLPLKYWGQVKHGQKVKVVLRGLEIPPLEAEVDAVVRILDAASGTFGIRLNIPNPGNGTPAGLWCDLAF